MIYDPLSEEYFAVFREDTFPDGRPCIVAEHPDLPGCVVYGDDEPEARALLAQARVAYVRFLLEHDKPLPAPRKDRPVEWRIGSVTTGTAMSEESGREGWRIARGDDSTPADGVESLT